MQFDSNSAFPFDRGRSTTPTTAQYVFSRMSLSAIHSDQLGASLAEISVDEDPTPAQSLVGAELTRRWKTVSGAFRGLDIRDRDILIRDVVHDAIIENTSVADLNSYVGNLCALLQSEDCHHILADRLMQCLHADLNSDDLVDATRINRVASAISVVSGESVLRAPQQAQAVDFYLRRVEILPMLSPEFVEHDVDTVRYLSALLAEPAGVALFTGPIFEDLNFAKLLTRATAKGSWAGEKMPGTVLTRFKQDLEGRMGRIGLAIHKSLYPSARHAVTRELFRTVAPLLDCQDNVRCADAYLKKMNSDASVEFLKRGRRDDPEFKQLCECTVMLLLENNLEIPVLVGSYVTLDVDAAFFQERRAQLEKWMTTQFSSVVKASKSLTDLLGDESLREAIHGVEVANQGFEDIPAFDGSSGSVTVTVVGEDHFGGNVGPQDRVRKRFESVRDRLAQALQFLLLPETQAVARDLLLSPAGTPSGTASPTGNSSRRMLAGKAILHVMHHVADSTIPNRNFSVPAPLEAALPFLLHEFTEEMQLMHVFDGNRGQLYVANATEKAINIFDFPVACSWLALFPRDPFDLSVLNVNDNVEDALSEMIPSVEAQLERWAKFLTRSLRNQDEDVGFSGLLVHAHSLRSCYGTFLGNSHEPSLSLLRAWSQLVGEVLRSGVKELAPVYVLLTPFSQAEAETIAAFSSEWLREETGALIKSLNSAILQINQSGMTAAHERDELVFRHRMAQYFQNFFFRGGEGSINGASQKRYRRSLSDYAVSP